MSVRETAIHDYRYLELFTKMTYFTRFVERLTYPQNQDDKLLEKMFYQSKQKSAKGQPEKMKHDCSVFFDIMQESRDQKQFISAAEADLTF